MKDWNRLRQTITRPTGFTLIELVLVLVLLAILVLMALPRISNQTELARERVDRVNLRTLNSVTEAYCADKRGSGPFAPGGSDAARWSALVPDYLPERMEARAEGKEFVFVDSDPGHPDYLRWAYQAAAAGGSGLNLLRGADWGSLEFWQQGGVVLTDDYKEGHRILKSQSDFSYLRQMVTGISGGEDYRLRFTARAEGSISGIVQLSWYDAAGKYINVPHNTMSFNPGPGWERLEMTNTAPAEAVSVRVEPLRGLRVPEGDNGRAYVYGVEFYQVP